MGIIDKVTDDFYVKFKEFIKPKGRIVQIAILLVTIFIGIAAYLFGDEITGVIKGRIHALYTKKTVNKFLSLNLGYKVNGNMAINGTVCHSGDRIDLVFAVGDSCYISFLGIDQKSRFGLPHQPDMARLYEPKQGQGDVAFQLDNTTGGEVYYIIGSNSPFSLQRDILSKLPPPLPEQRRTDQFIKQITGKKGAVDESYYLPIDSTFTVKYINFEHM
jgi:hypothetical protein